MGRCAIQQASTRRPRCPLKPAVAAAGPAGSVLRAGGPDAHPSNPTIPFSACVIWAALWGAEHARRVATGHDGALMANELHTVGPLFPIAEHQSAQVPIICVHNSELVAQSRE